MPCRFSPLAELDLEEIGDYIARDNPRRAVSFIEEIRTRCFLILQTPQGSPLRETLGTDIRVLPFGNYLIYYTVNENTDEVRIERILHASRNIDQSFFR